MTQRIIHFSLAALIAGAASLANASHASSAEPRTSATSGDRYGYTFHNAPRDPFTEGARRREGDGNGAISRLTDWLPDGASHSASNGFSGVLAGMDRSGVSAPPDQDGKHAG
ncbi:hypothetical protein [Cupriavidus plantarum]|uniref:Uncharacterized protein n=1 Tax=Cupriavidus plantarum TaxID=942865 RepID=A0A316ETP3_9BURK|nr:hypothetical protein [Cupriavidus plantarum]NYI00682.1 hypothetical protein [Cupriavidus plantarum]PWK35092.1 hypothetical protein C7419_102368 [Cupriavidus plantarum]REE93540.1 hypothetical protein C7418_2307 [Cupriavidus plantarum]RLK38962.1 hypothetical protein C7417_2489 [Cupriavidus plantarum]